MAVRGAQSKKIVEDKILAMFPGSFVTDKKIYINFKEDNQPLQIAVSMTCPKGIINGESSQGDGGINSDDYISQKPSIEFTEKEKETVEMLLSKL